MYFRGRRHGADTAQTDPVHPESITAAESGPYIMGAPDIVQDHGDSGFRKLPVLLHRDPAQFDIETLAVMHRKIFRKVFNTKVVKIKNRATFVFILLGIAFSANIGGIGTLVGTPPNAIVASRLDITFAEWLKFGIPVVIIFMPLMIAVLYFVLKPNLTFQINTDIEDKIPMDTQKYITLAIFVFIAVCWIFSSSINPFFSNLVGLSKPIANFDGIIAILAAILVCAFRVVSWKNVSDNTDWGVLLLFGGGITLSIVLGDSGASKIMANGIINLVSDTHLFIILLLVACLAACMYAHAQLTLDECRREARANYPLVRQYRLIEQSEAYTLSNNNRHRC